jgi:hypothetical protein
MDLRKEISLISETLKFMAFPNSYSFKTNVDNGLVINLTKNTFSINHQYEANQSSIQLHQRAR